MEVNIEKECSALGGLFQQIITDMKNGAPLWEDLISKATKLHTCLRTAILAISAYLEAFQKIADAATSARGATKEIGTALTRICLRHKAVEARMKTFTSAIMDCLVMPLQEKLEDWKKSLVNLDKEHAKEYKKARAELKKRSTDTLRLQKKKARKTQCQTQGHGQGNDAELARLMETSAAVVREKRIGLEETERRAVRAALLEERGRYCLLARFLKPVLDEEMAMLMELTHLQEVADQLQRHTATPQHLPPSSEQVITDIKWSIATPPSSPSLSLGSRKSSMCSISSLTSSSSGSCPSPSPSIHPWHRSLSQPGGARPFSGTGFGIATGMLGMTLRHLTGGTSRDSGFTSQDTLYAQPIAEHEVSNASSQSNQSTGGCITTRPVTTATWPDLQESSVRFDKQNQNAINGRPHTISSAYESKGHHQRPALSVYTFQAPERDQERDAISSCHSQPASPVSSSSSCSSSNQYSRIQLRKNNGNNGNNRPPIPSRCSSLERPTVPAKTDPPDSPRGKPKLPLPAHLAKVTGLVTHQQPMYVNMHELASLAANRAQEMLLPLPPPPPSAPVTDKTDGPERDGGSLTSESSLESSSGYGSQTTLPHSHSHPQSQVLYQGVDEDIATNQQTAYSTATVITRHQNQNQNENARTTAALLMRRGSMQQAVRPAPPVRRTSTVIGGSYVAPDLNPDSRLIDAQGKDHRNENDNDEALNLPPPPAFLLEGEGTPVSTQPNPQRSISVSETVRTLTELRHTPASPSFLRKANSSNNPPVQVAQNNLPTATLARQSQGPVSGTGTQGPGGVGQGFMAVLSAKLVPSSLLSNNVPTCTASTHANTNSCSPKYTRRHSAERAAQNRSSPSGFLSTLNVKLAHQQQQQQQQGVTHVPGANSTGIRRIMGNRDPMMDPLQVRDSLMDQIRRGTALRKTSGPINDRSAPKIY